jgi:hypothetical protein
MHFSTLLQTVVLAIIGAQVTANPVPVGLQNMLSFLML